MAELLILPVDNLLSIFLELQVKELVEFSKDELYPFLTSKEFLDMVAVKHNLPFCDSLEDLQEYKEKPTLNARLYLAAEKGNITAVKRMVNLGAKDYNYAMTMAALAGHADIVMLMLDYGANNYSAAINRAARGGHKELVLLFLELDPDKYQDGAIEEAAKAGHYDIVALILEHTDPNRDIDQYSILLTTGIETAAEVGNKEIVELILSQIDPEDDDYGIYPDLLNAAMESAAKYGQTDIIKLMIQMDATNYDGARYAALSADHLDIYELFSNETVDDPNLILEAAAEGGYIDVVREMLESGATKTGFAIQSARERGHYDIVELLKERLEKRMRQ